jgi:hypothetical protein
MDWKPRFYWALLALLTALIGWRLTRLITHVNHGATSLVTILYDEQSPIQLRLTNVDVAVLERARFQVPRVVVSGSSETVFVVTARTRVITILDVKPQEASCSFTDRAFRSGSMPYLIDTLTSGAVKPLPITMTQQHGTLITIPRSLHVALTHVTEAQGAIRCVLRRPLAAAPTFTGRSLTIQARNGSAGVVVLDVSALEDIDNVRFSGGIANAFLGDRTRILGPNNDVVSVEWDDVSAEEQRDIVLVTIGALAAIAAAMVIEALRPFIER